MPRPRRPKLYPVRQPADRRRMRGPYGALYRIKNQRAGRARSDHVEDRDDQLFYCRQRGIRRGSGGADRQRLLPRSVAATCPWSSPSKRRNWSGSASKAASAKTREGIETWHFWKSTTCARRWTVRKFSRESTCPSTAGQVHAIMGPNGSGKARLSYVLSGRDGYEVTEGEVLYDGKNLMEDGPGRARPEGVFLAFQYPVEIPGVPRLTFLKTAVNSVASASRREANWTPCSSSRFDRASRRSFHLQRHAEARPSIPGSPAVRRNAWKILQMAVLEPRLAILDETDSGLDIDALKLCPRASMRCAAGARHADDHPLPAPAGLYRSRSCARSLGTDASS